MTTDKFNIGTETASVQPKLGYRFMVGFTGLGDESASNAAITGYVNSFTPANFSQEAVMVDAYVSRYYVIGKHTIGSLTVEFRNDANNTVARLLQKQVDRQYNAREQSHAANAGAVKFTTKLFYLDGTGGFDSSPEILEGFVYTGCWIEDLNFGQSTYSDSNPVNISVTIRPDNFYHVFDPKTVENVNVGKASVTEITAPVRTGTSAI